MLIENKQNKVAQISSINAFAPKPKFFQPTYPIQITSF